MHGKMTGSVCTQAAKHFVTKLAVLVLANVNKQQQHVFHPAEA